MLELLEQGADPNSRRATGTTPLFFAAQGGYLDVVKILIKAGASVDTPSVVSLTFFFSKKYNILMSYRQIKKNLGIWED